MERDAYIQLLGARQEILRLIGESVAVASIVLSPGARDHLRHGLGRRLRLLLRSADLIWQSVPPDRSRPLAGEEATDLNLHLNSIYIHIRGASDNLAWALALEHRVLGPAEENKRAFQRRVGLFDARFRQALARGYADFDAAISPHCDLLAQLPQLRAPVAHRIPLYVIPSVLNQKEAERYHELEVEANTAAAEGAFSRAEERLDAMSALGKFHPFFAHSLVEPPEMFPLHERLASDLAALAAIVSATYSFLRKHAA